MLIWNKVESSVMHPFVYSFLWHQAQACGRELKEIVYVFDLHDRDRDVRLPSLQPALGDCFGTIMQRITRVAGNDRNV
jgi:hypothetical protein